MASLKPRTLKNGTVVLDVCYRLPGGGPRKKTFRSDRDSLLPR
jgi:hypothetical protein